MFNLIFVLMKRFFDFSELDLQVRIAGFESSLFDFVALSSCCVNRELMFSRLRFQLTSEGYSFGVVYKIVTGCLREPSDLSRLLRFSVLYFDVTTPHQRLEFLQSFNNWYGCDLQMSDYEVEFPKIF